MPLDFIAIAGCCILGLIAHGTRHQPWLQWILRGLYVLVLGGELLSLTAEPNPADESGAWSRANAVVVATITGLMLFKPFRQVLSYLLTILNQIVAGRVFLAAAGWLKGAAAPPIAAPQVVSNAPGEPADAGAAEAPAVAETRVDSGSAPPAPSQAVAVQRKIGFVESFVAERVFVPSSMPHLNGLWIYVSCLGYLAANTELSGMKFPMLPIAMPVTIEQLFSYNGLGLVVLSLCGVGIFVGRKPKETLTRLGLVKPSLKHVAIGIFMIFFTFFYDYVWSTFTHAQTGMEYAEKLSRYNEGTFATGGGASDSFVLALFTGICAGVGEETLIRGALQPVFGIFPAAFLHGALHGQFAHAPLFMLQVAGWSTIMGIVRRYTNTTTTIICHAGFNFLTAFLFAFNPPG